MDQAQIRVLLVTNTPAEFKALRASLARDHWTFFDLTITKELAEALRDLLQGQFDLLLLDWGPDDRTGLEILTRLHEQVSELPVIVLADQADERLALEAIRAGAQDYLVKGRQTWKMAPCAMRFALERLQGQKALRASAERFHTVADFTYDWEYWIDSNAQILYMSPSCERVSGYRVSDFQADPGLLERIIHPDDLPAYQQHVALEFLSEQVGKLDFRIQLPTGAISWINHVCQPVFGPDGQRVGRRVSNREITERKQTEHNLQVTLAKYNTLFESFPLGITVSDAEGKVVETNLIAEKLLQLPRGEHQHRKIDGPEWHIIRPDGSPMPSTEFASVRALNEGCRVENVEMGIVTPAGTTWLSVTAAPLPLPGYGVVVTYGDITQRKQAEDDLRRSEALLAEAQRIGRIGYLEWKAPDQILVCSDELYRILELPRDGVPPCRETLARYVSPADQQRLLEQEKQAFAARADLDYEYALHFPDGRERWVRQRSQFTYNENGRPVRMIATVQDVTELKSAEAALRASALKWRTLFETCPVGIALATPAGQITDVNPAYLAQLGYTREEMLQIPYQQITPARWQAEEAQNIVRLRVDGQPILFEKEHIRKDGTIFPVELTGWQICDEAGQQNTLGVFVQDISERKRVETELRLSEERYRLIAEYVDDIVWQLDMQLQFMYVSPAVERVLGFSVAEVQGLPATELLDESGLAQMRQVIETRLRDPTQAGKPTEYKMKHKLGHWVEVEVLSSPVFDHAGQPTGFVGITRNISARKQAELALRASEEKFRRAFLASPDAVNINRLADGMYVSVNHGFTQIMGYTEAEVLGKTSLELGIWVDPADRQRLAAGLQRDGLVENLEARFRAKDGSLRDGLMSASLLELDGVPHIISITRDITERTRIEAALRESHATAQAILNAATETVFLMETSGVVIAANETTAARLGQSLQNLVGANIYAFLPPEVADSRKKQLEIVIREGHPVVFEDERYGVWLENSIYPIYDPDGQIRRVAIYGRDITQRKQAEAALAESEDHFRRLAENSPSLIYRYNFVPQRGFTFVSPAAIEITGYTPEEHYADPDLGFKLVHPDDRPLLKDVTTGGELLKKPLILRWVRKDGTMLWTEQRNVPIYDSQGNLVAIEGIANDITERVQAEAALRASEEKYRGLMESLDTVVATIDYDGRFLYMNDVSAQHLGGSAIELIGKNMFELFPPTVAERQLNAVREVIDQDRGRVSETVSIVRGQPRWYRNSLQPIHDVDGKALYALLNATDIDDLKTAQQKLQELNQTLEARIKERTAEIQDLYDNAPAGYHSLDPHGRFMIINQTELNWLGYAREEVLGRPVNDFFTPASVQIFREQFPLYKQRGYVKDLELEFVRKDGSAFPIVVNGVAVYDEQGQIVMSRSTVFDNTERKAAEEAMRRANLEMERALRLKDEFLANMSHELRTPLNGILGLSEILLKGYRGPLNEYQLKFVRNIDASGRHLLELINDLLDVSKIEAGKLELHPELVMIAEVCQASLMFVKEAAIKKEISLDYVTATNLPIVWADQRRLKQILVNLLSNAVKFTPRQGQITLTVSLDSAQEYLEFSVRDTGIGIAPADLQRLFTPFTQVDSSLSRQYEGTGLGLALVKRLAELHGGRISVTSVVGQGSCFTVSLPWEPHPAAQSSQPATRSATSEAASPNPAPVSNLGKLLLVEDNETSLMTIGDFLENLGYQVEIARNGLEGIQKAVEISPILILMDIQMPQMDGLEAIRRLRARAEFADTPIIALTALAMPGDREQCLAIGANEYLSKPVSLKALAEMIEALLVRHA